MDDKSGYFLSSGVTRSSPVLFTSVPGLITCVQLNLAMITVHLNYVKRRLDSLKLLPCRTDELDAVNKLNERNSAW